MEDGAEAAPPNELRPAAEEGRYAPMGPLATRVAAPVEGAAVLMRDGGRGIADSALPLAAAAAAAAGLGIPDRIGGRPDEPADTTRRFSIRS